MDTLHNSVSSTLDTIKLPGGCKQVNIPRLHEGTSSLKEAVWPISWCPFCIICLCDQGPRTVRCDVE